MYIHVIYVTSLDVTRELTNFANFEQLFCVYVDVIVTNLNCYSSELSYIVSKNGLLYN